MSSREMNKEFDLEEGKALLSSPSCDSLTSEIETESDREERQKIVSSGRKGKNGKKPLACCGCGPCFWWSIVIVLCAVVALLLSIVFQWDPWIRLIQWYNSDVDVLYYSPKLRAANRKVIALTIDDVPWLHEGATSGILDVLKKHEASSTLFVISELAKKNDEAKALLRRAVQEGQELGNHGEIDEYHVDLSNEKLLQTTQLWQNTMSDIVPGAKIKWWRPARGFYTKDQVRLMKKKHGYRTALGSAHPLDPGPYGFPRWLTRIFLRWKTGPGEVFVLHDRKFPDTAAVLDEWLTYWKEKGYEVVSLSEFAAAEEALPQA